MQDGDDDGGNSSTDGVNGSAYGDSPTARDNHHSLTGCKVIILVVILLLVLPFIMPPVFNCYDFVVFLINGDAALLLDKAIRQRESLLYYSKSGTRVFLEDLYAGRN